MAERNVDTLRVKRILGMIEAQPTGSGQADKMTFRGPALVDTYNMILREVEAILPADLLDEFHRLFKPLPEPSGNLHDLFGQQQILQRAISSFTTLGGWLRGVIRD